MGGVRINLWQLIFCFSVALPLRAGEFEAFHVDPQAIREMALAALEEKHPHLSREDLDNRSPHQQLIINCFSSQENASQASSNEDSTICVAQIDFRIKSTIVTEQYVDKNGACMAFEESETVSVLVYPDGSTSVSCGGNASSSYTVECTEDFEFKLK